MDDSGILADTLATGVPGWGWGSDLCAPFVALLPVTGASISVFGVSGPQLVLCSSDEVATRLEELQFDLGEGPCWVVARTGVSVICADVVGDPHPDWPVFAAEIAGLPVGAVFALPVRMGAVTVGVVELYRSSPGILADSALSRARSLARTVAAPAVRAAIRSATAESTTESRAAPAIRREVHQAIGMILIQLEATATEAFARLRAHAFSHGRTVDEVAADVVARRLDFTDLPE